jgi:hypothetical protein
MNMEEKTNKDLDGKLEENTKPKYKVPVLTFEEFLKNEAAPKEKRIRGPLKIREEDVEKFEEYLKRNYLL